MLQSIQLFKGKRDTNISQNPFEYRSLSKAGGKDIILKLINSIRKY